MLAHDDLQLHERGCTVLSHHTQEATPPQLPRTFMDNSCHYVVDPMQTSWHWKHHGHEHLHQAGALLFDDIHVPKFWELERLHVLKEGGHM